MCELIKNNLVNLTGIFLLICVLLTLFLYLRDLFKSKGNLTFDKIKALESIVNHAVNLSEQLYKTDKNLDRFKNAFELVMELTGRIGLSNKKGFDKLVTALIESFVLKLPKSK